MTTGHVGVSGMEASRGGDCTLRPVSLLPSLGVTEDMIHSVTD